VNQCRFIIIFYVISNIFIQAERVRLRGMFVYGYTSPNGPQETLYQDAGKVTSCGPYNYHYIGTNICGDVLLIPITSPHQFHIVGIATNNYLSLREVQVFAGKYVFNIHYYLFLRK